MRLFSIGIGEIGHIIPTLVVGIHHCAGTASSVIPGIYVLWVATAQNDHTGRRMAILEVESNRSGYIEPLGWRYIKVGDIRTGLLYPALSEGTRIDHFALAPHVILFI
jgi:hypothetical protein